MNDHHEIIRLLKLRLSTLEARHAEFSNEIDRLKQQISAFNQLIESAQVVQEKPSSSAENEKEVTVNVLEDAFTQTTPTEIDYSTAIPQNTANSASPSAGSRRELPSSKSSIEKFIGENLINKIGIAILVIGIGIGMKYSIEHDLISPLTRTILGYLTGTALLVVGMKLKAKYENYSAVLVSGAIAAMYFVTFAAYSFYQLIPQTLTFGIMVLFTAFTVVAALNYKREVIAIIGLVGAYAVPFLLSDGSGKVIVLFSYMAIINTGILLISIKQSWKIVNISAFVLTWIIYAGWFTTKYDKEEHLVMASIFSSLFFITFYITFIANKITNKVLFVYDDILLIMANSFVFFALGFVLIQQTTHGDQLLGLYTLANAIIHFLVSVIIYRFKLADRNIFYLISGLVLVFITIAIPIQLNGHWVTMLYIAEAGILFYIGANRKVVFYEWMSYPLMALATASLLQDWNTYYQMVYDNYNQPTDFIPLFNIHFVNSLLFIAALVFIQRTFAKNRQNLALFGFADLLKIVDIGLKALLLGVVYNSLRLEIDIYWQQRYIASALVIDPEMGGWTNYNKDLLSFKSIWTLNYSLLFVSALSLFALRFKNITLLGTVSVFLGFIAVIGFLFYGSYELYNLRSSYINEANEGYYTVGTFHLMIRYVSYAFTALCIYLLFRSKKAGIIIPQFAWSFDLLLHFTGIWIASSELMNWLDLAGNRSFDKLGLSILWGVYSLFVVSLGIAFNKKHLRIGAFVLFGITLLKLFIYDMSNLDTIAKTIVFVSLGVLLLIISFLYNKFKSKIIDDSQE